MVMFRNKKEYTKFVFLASIIFFSLLYMKIPTEMASSQTLSSSTSFQAKDSTYKVNPSSGDIQKKTYDSIPKDHILKNLTVVSNPLTSNPTYSITNATISIKTSVLEGLSSNNMMFVNQSVVVPLENSLIGQTQRN
jgi:hypothetical protein